jgi:hypothetical protein
VVAALRTEHTPNNSPRLPVREDAEVLAVLSRHASHDELAAVTARLAAHGTAGAARNRLAPVEAAPSDRLVLEPTARSALR